jgi:CrcB protein
MSIANLLAVALGGVVGAVARYLVYIATAHLLGHGFPYATLIVNIAGSFAMGVLIEGMALAWNLSAALRLFLVVGVLGSFTTFSTFSLDFVVLYQRRELLLTGIYLVASVVLSIGGLLAGLHVVRKALPPPL